MMHRLLLIGAAVMTIMAGGCKGRTPVAEKLAPSPAADETSSLVETREGQSATKETKDITEPKETKAAESVKVATSVGTASSKGEAGITTAYRDLPEGPRAQLETLLRTTNLSSLKTASLDVLWEYFNSKVLQGYNPMNHLFDTNYFWFIYNALPEFVDSRERHHGYYRDENKQPANERLLAYAIYRLDRSPQTLSRLFEMLRPRLKDMVPPSQYDRLGFRQTVQQLISTHETISGIEHHRQKLSSFYQEFYTPTGAMKVEDNEIVQSMYNSSYGFSSQELSMHLSQRLGMDRFSPHYSSPHLSFWMRRNAEGNMDEVFRILKQIQAIYE